tara:strand:+ start:9267 stop:9554 length:288 start_codon:yes stop_codon:yes gene_type:complete
LNSSVVVVAVARARGAARVASATASASATARRLTSTPRASPCFERDARRRAVDDADADDATRARAGRRTPLRGAVCGHVRGLAVERRREGGRARA